MMHPTRFRPGELATYTNVKWPKAGMGPRGPSDRRAVRLMVKVLAQAHGPANHNALCECRNGAMFVTTWGHLRRIKR
jgi:hypothetical protein